MSYEINPKINIDYQYNLQIKENVDLENNFNKHKKKCTNNKNDSKKIVNCFKIFNREIIEKNKMEIKEFHNSNLIKEDNHFCIDDQELYKKNFTYDENNNEKNKKCFNKEQENEENEENNYFDLIQDKTINDNFYCSYADFFDKTYVKNKEMFKNNKNSKDIKKSNGINDREYKNPNILNKNQKSKIYTLSCAGCFNQICNKGELVNNHNSIYFTDNLENAYLDYMLVLNTNQLLNYIDKSIQKVNINLNDLTNSPNIKGRFYRNYEI